MCTNLTRTALLFLVLGVFLASCERTPVEPEAPDPASQVAGELAPLLSVNSSLSQVSQDRFIVVLKENLPTRDVIAEQLSRLHSDTTYHVFRHALSGFAAKLTPQAVQALRSHPAVAYIEQDRPVYDHGVDTSPGWGLGRIDQRNGPSDFLYNYNFTGQGVHIYIVDSGVNSQHADFGGRVWPGWTFDNDYPAGSDCSGHGTAVASIAAGNEYGVARSATIHDVRTNDCDSWGWLSDRITGFEWVIGTHISPAVLNASFGVVSWVNNVLPGSLGDAAKNAWDAGIFVVTSAGNDSDNACGYVPANIGKIVTVAATDSNDSRPSWSNYGSCVDLFAPGKYVNVANYLGGYAIGSGTSYSAPFVAGVGALYLEQFPEDSNYQVSYAIRTGATTGVVSNPGAGSPNRLLYSFVPVPLEVWIEGPTLVGYEDEACEWTARVSGGRYPFTYQWSGALNGSGIFVFGEVSDGETLYLDVWDTIGGHDTFSIVISVDPDEENLCDA